MFGTCTGERGLGQSSKISPRCEQSNVGGQRGKLSLTLVGLATVDVKVPFGFTFSSAIFGPVIRSTGPGSFADYSSASRHAAESPRDLLLDSTHGSECGMEGDRDNIGCRSVASRRLSSTMSQAFDRESVLDSQTDYPGKVLSGSQTK